MITKFRNSIFGINLVTPELISKTFVILREEVAKNKKGVKSSAPIYGHVRPEKI